MDIKEILNGHIKEKCYPCRWCGLIPSISYELTLNGEQSFKLRCVNECGDFYTCSGKIGNIIEYWNEYHSYNQLTREEIIDMTVEALKRGKSMIINGEKAENLSLSMYSDGIQIKGSFMFFKQIKTIQIEK
jgi:hypothetical protein